MIELDLVEIYEALCVYERVLVVVAKLVREQGMDAEKFDRWVCDVGQTRRTVGAARDLGGGVVKVGPYEPEP